MRTVMGLFTKLCRNFGLMIHNVKHPDHEHRVVNKKVEEEKRGNMTLRRTTIDEIEIRHPGNSSGSESNAKDH